MDDKRKVFIGGRSFARTLEQKDDLERTIQFAIAEDAQIKQFNQLKKDLLATAQTTVIVEGPYSKIVYDAQSLKVLATLDMFITHRANQIRSYYTS